MRFLHLLHLLLDQFLLIEQLGLHGRHFPLLGNNFFVLGTDHFGERRDFLFQLRDFGDVVRIVVAFFAFVFQLWHFGDGFVQGHFGHIGTLRFLVIEILVPERRSRVICTVIIILGNLDVILLTYFGLEPFQEIFKVHKKVGP